MDSPERIYPPRLREVQAKEEEERRQTEQQRRRRRYIVGSILLLVLLLPLLYGLIERNVVRPRVDSSVPAETMGVRPDEHIQVNILNACEVPGVAQRFSEFLRARKFDVPEYGNATETEPFSMVIDRVGDSLSALKVAYALGITPKFVVTEIDSTLFLRATVVIGKDFRSLRPMREE